MINLGCCLLCFLCTISQAETTVYWFSDNAEETPQQAEITNSHVSTLADTSRLLINSLPQYQFTTEYVESQRIARLLKKLPNSCAPNRIKTPERVKDNIYSLPLNIYLSLKLYYKKHGKGNILPASAVNDDQQIESLAALFTGKSNYTLGVNEGRSFGVFLDKQIASLDKHNLVIRHGTESTTSLVKMLLKDRIDYTIEYPVNVHKVLVETNSDVELESIAVAGSPSYIVGYVACNKGKEGEEIIREINTALQALYHSVEFYQAHTRYIDKLDIPAFNQAYQETFKVAIPRA